MAFYYRLLFPNQAFRQLEDIERLTPFMYLNAMENTKPSDTPVEIPPEPEPEPIHRRTFELARPVQMFDALQLKHPFTRPEDVPNGMFEGVKNIIQETLPEPPPPPSKESTKPSVILQPTFDCLQNTPNVEDCHLPHRSIYPKQSDTLFWCLYIAIHGYNQFMQIGHRYSNTEIEEKQRMVEMMKKDPNKIRQDCPKRITKAQFQEIMSDFMTNKKMTIPMLIAFVIYHNIRVLIINQDSSWYMDLHDIETQTSPESAKSPVIIHSKILGRTEKYGIELYNDTVTGQLNSLFKFDNYDQPLKAISNYKTTDLYNISDKLGIVIEGKQKKQDVYNSIVCKIHC